MTTKVKTKTASRGERKHTQQKCEADISAKTMVNDILLHHYSGTCLSSHVNMVASLYLISWFSGQYGETLHLPTKTR